MRPFWTPDCTYIAPYPLGSFTSLPGWFWGEHIPFNDAFDTVTFSQLIFVGEESTASTTTYAIARFKGPFRAHNASADSPALQPTMDTVRIRITDFYRFEGSQIATNWMMLDLVDVMRQTHGRVILRGAAAR